MKCNYKYVKDFIKLVFLSYFSCNEIFSFQLLLTIHHFTYKCDIFKSNLITLIILPRKPEFSNSYLYTLSSTLKYWKVNCVLLKTDTTLWFKKRMRWIERKIRIVSSRPKHFNFSKNMLTVSSAREEEPALGKRCFLWMTLNCIQWWGFSSGALGNVECPFVGIIPRFTLTQSRSTF